jgi:hypothetical protein
MATSQQWHEHFTSNLKHQRVDWSTPPCMTELEKTQLIPSLQAWQLGETSDGAHLIKAATNYAHKINDLHYIDAVKLFIKEEQKHGKNLGRYLDEINTPRLKKDWGDSLFRKIRYYNNSMELWTLAVITVESCAQIFYQSVKDATNCNLLKNICTDILIDEAHHIDFQRERFQIIVSELPKPLRWLRYLCYKIFFNCTAQVVWYAHKKAFIAGGNSHEIYNAKMNLKFQKTILRIFKQQPTQSWMMKKLIPIRIYQTTNIK